MQSTKLSCNLFKIILVLEVFQIMQLSKRIVMQIEIEGVICEIDMRLEPGGLFARIK